MSFPKLCSVPPSFFKIAWLLFYHAVLKDDAKREESENNNAIFLFLVSADLLRTCFSVPGTFDFGMRLISGNVFFSAEND